MRELDIQKIIVAPATVAMAEYLQPFQRWIEAVLECPAHEAVTLQFDRDYLCDFVCREFLDGVDLDNTPQAQCKLLRSSIKRWEIPDQRVPRIDLNPTGSKDKQGWNLTKAALTHG